MLKTGIAVIAAAFLTVLMTSYSVSHAGQSEPLIDAVAKGDLKQVKQLLDKGVDINAKDDRGRTPLMKAAEAGSLDVVKLLLDRGADVNAKSPSLDMTALMFAADRGNLEIAKLLLDRGADLNANLYWGTALMKACASGHLPIASLLLERGAEMSSTDTRGCNALMKAAEADHLDVVRFLLEKGADINAKDKYGKTALKKASAKGHTAVAELLLSNGADVNATDMDGVTPLMTAAKSGQLETAQLLLDRGAQLNARDKKGRTALEHAASENHRRIVDLLIIRGAKTNLAVASMVGDTAEVQRLLKEGANVNAKDDQGHPVLILAVEHGHLEVVKLLIENGADVKASAETALDIAQQKGFDEIYTVLRSNGAKSREGLRILKYADKVLRRGDELFFRLTNGKIVSRKDSPDQESDSMVRYEFRQVIDPWYVIREGYYECSGGQLLHRDSGQSTTVAGSLYFSPDNARFLALGCPDEGGPDEIWKMTNSGPVKEYVLKTPGGSDCDWAGPSTVNVLLSSDDNTVIGRFILDPVTGKWSCSQQESEEMFARKMCDDATADLDFSLKNAVDEGDLEAVKRLLGKGAHVNAEVQFAMTALVRAACRGHLEIVKLLLAKGAGTDESEKAKALECAARYGHKEVVALLISHGAKLTLPVAAAIGDVKAIKRLIRGGADVNATDEHHISAFRNAVERNQWDAAILLLENGPQIKIASVLDTALLSAAAKDGHTEMIRTFLEKEPAEREELFPVLEAAASEGKLEIVKLLLAKGADVNGKDKHDRTPLMAAAIKGQRAVAEFLLAKGADVNARDLDRVTALMDAAWGANPQTVKLLLDKGSEVNATDVEGRTALQYAKLGKSKEIAELLKAHGAKE